MIPDPVEVVVASARLEGIALPEGDVAAMRRYMAGELTHDELLAQVLESISTDTPVAAS